LPRWRNLWVTDIHSALKGRLAGREPDVRQRGFGCLLFVANCLSNQFVLSGKHYGVREEVITPAIRLALGIELSVTPRC
jgi:hypothetical protein